MKPSIPTRAYEQGEGPQTVGSAQGSGESLKPPEPGVRVLGHLRIEQVLERRSSHVVYLADDEERSELVLLLLASSSESLGAVLARHASEPPQRRVTLGPWHLAQVAITEELVHRYADQLFASPASPETDGGRRSGARGGSASSGRHAGSQAGSHANLHADSHADSHATSGTAPSSDPRSVPRLGAGSLFGGRYRVHAFIGRGGMGEVYRAYDETFQRAVALKIVHVASVVATADREEAKRRLLHEARIVATLKHPNIVEVYDAGEADGFPYLVLELCEGGNLRRVVQGNEAAEADKLRWMEELALALEYAHRNGVIHRDLKPENVVLTDGGRAKLVDFGIAKALHRPEARNDVSTDIVGTPRYMAPEQLLGDALDGRADQYTWAVVAYEIWSGRPLQRASAFATVSRGSLEEAGFPPRLAALLARALEHRRELRFADMTELVAAFDKARRVPAAKAPPRPWFRASGLLTAMAAVLAVAATLSVRLRSGRSSPPSDDTAPASSVAPPMVDLAALDATTLERCAPEARPHLAAGIQLFRDASQWEALPHFEAAAQADGNCAAASLFYLDAATHTYPRRREHFRLAREHRAQLSERQLDLLHVLEPTLDDPPSYEEHARRAAELALRRPNDGDAFRVHARALYRLHRFEDALKVLDAAAAREPQPVPSLEYLAALVHVRLRHMPEAATRFQACLGASPDSADCLQWRGLILASQGACQESERDLRRLAAVMPNSAYAYFALGNVLLTTTRDPAAARSAFEQRWAHLAKDAFGGSSSPELARLADEFRMAIVSGDLNEGLARARAWNDAVKASNHGRYRGEPLLQLIALLRELGRVHEARLLALRGLREQRSWTHDQWLEASIELARQAYETGGLDATQYRQARDEWLASSERTPDERWLRAYAGLPVVGQDMVPPVKPTELVQDWFAMSPESYSRAADELVQQGRPVEAVRHAEAATRCCLAFNPMGHLHARMSLARAYDAASDRTNACKAYGDVEELLRKAPQSQSGQAARRRRQELGCGPVERRGTP